jgi:NAD+ synthase (glutamine-hydrolysing)
MSLDGCEIFTNSSGSHHELRKFASPLNSYTDFDSLRWGSYLYANQQGCDGDRLYYDGSAIIVLNGQLLSQGAQFALSEVVFNVSYLNGFFHLTRWSLLHGGSSEGSKSKSLK